jgi:hypothetical protein
VSNRNRLHSKGRIQGQWTAVRWEIMQSPAWKYMSMGARLLYIALIKHLSFTADNNGKIFLATRKAAEDLGASQRVICVWFRELEHFGFIAMTEPGSIGPKGRATRWRITDVGWGKLDRKPIEPTKDYLKWSGELFDRQPKKQKNGERKYSGRRPKVLRGGDDQKYSLPNPSDDQKYSEGSAFDRERKYSNLGQPYLHPLLPDITAKPPWVTDPQPVQGWSSVGFLIDGLIAGEARPQPRFGDLESQKSA